VLIPAVVIRVVLARAAEILCVFRTGVAAEPFACSKTRRSSGAAILVLIQWRAILQPGLLGLPVVFHNLTKYYIHSRRRVVAHQASLNQK
jgi:hypothetical protein